MKKENIKVNAIDFSGINESLQGIDESDLCTIICNLMDNAVEACQKCKGEKSISLTVVKEINYIKIRVANNAETTNLAYNGKALKTSKKIKQATVSELKLLMIWQSCMMVKHTIN